MLPYAFYTISCLFPNVGPSGVPNRISAEGKPGQQQPSRPFQDPKRELVGKVEILF